MSREEQDEKQPEVPVEDTMDLKGYSLIIIVKTVISFIVFSIAISFTKYIMCRYHSPQNLIKDKVVRCAVNTILDRQSWVSHVSLLCIFILQFVMVDIHLTNYMIVRDLDYHTIKTNQRVLRLFVVGIFSGLTWELIKVRCEGQ